MSDNIPLFPSYGIVSKKSILSVSWSLRYPNCSQNKYPLVFTFLKVEFDNAPGLQLPVSLLVIFHMYLLCPWLPPNSELAFLFVLSVSVTFLDPMFSSTNPLIPLVLQFPLSTDGPEVSNVALLCPSSSERRVQTRAAGACSLAGSSRS